MPLFRQHSAFFSCAVQHWQDYWSLAFSCFHLLFSIIFSIVQDYYIYCIIFILIPQYSTKLLNFTNKLFIKFSDYFFESNVYQRISPTNNFFRYFFIISQKTIRQPNDKKLLRLIWIAFINKLVIDMDITLFFAFVKFINSDYTKIGDEEKAKEYYFYWDHNSKITKHCLFCNRFIITFL